MIRVHINRTITYILNAFFVYLLMVHAGFARYFKIYYLCRYMSIDRGSDPFTDLIEVVYEISRIFE